MGESLRTCVDNSDARLMKLATYKRQKNLCFRSVKLRRKYIFLSPIEGYSSSQGPLAEIGGVK